MVGLFPPTTLAARDQRHQIGGLDFDDRSSKFGWDQRSLNDLRSCSQPPAITRQVRNSLDEQTAPSSMSLQVEGVALGVTIIGARLHEEPRSSRERADEIAVKSGTRLRSAIGLTPVRRLNSPIGSASEWIATP